MTSKREIYVDDKHYIILDDVYTKTCKGTNYNFSFDKTNGFFMRYGRTKKHNPSFSPIGPELCDCEISTVCEGVNGQLCKFCSPAGTKINTANGLKNIENIRNGDLIIGFNTEENSLAIQEVKETYKRHYSGELICIEMDNGEVLRLTPEHIVVLKNGEEKQAKDIKENDEFILF